MKQIILNSPQQFKIGLERAEGVGFEGNFSNLVLCGVGGSAMPGILIADAFGDELKIPLYIHRSYGLPYQANEKSLVICLSFSGNTEETISSFESALQKGLRPVVITTGGKLEQMALEKGLPCCVVPNDCLQPRFGTAYLFAGLIKILINSGLLNQEVENKILSLKENLKPETFEKEGEKLAKKLIGKTPVIYSSDKYKSIARICKIKFNENSKTMAFWNYFPELNHNEMVGLTTAKSKGQKASSFYFLILKDSQDNPKIIKRIELTKELIKEAGCEVESIKMIGANKLEKMFNTLLLFDFASYYLALALGVDPISVPIVENFKKRLVK